MPKVLNTRGTLTTLATQIKLFHTFRVCASSSPFAFQRPNQGSRLLWEGGEDPRLGRRRRYALYPTPLHFRGTNELCTF